MLIEAVIAIFTKVTVTISCVVVLNSLALITTCVSMPVVFGNMMIRYFSCRTVQSTIGKE